MPPSKKKRGQAAGRQPAGGRQLLNATQEGDTAGVARLLAAGADDAIDPNASVPALLPSGKMIQTTLLCAAAGSGRLEVARLLLEGGADPSRAGDGITPLMAAAQKGNVDMVRFLLASGADATLLAKGQAARDMAVSTEVEALLGGEHVGSKRTSRGGGEGSSKRSRKPTDGAGRSAPPRATRRSQRNA